MAAAREKVFSVKLRNENKKEGGTPVIVMGESKEK